MSVTDEVKTLIEHGKLQGLVQKFKDEGLDKEVSSWISKGENLPVAGDQIKKVLGNDIIAGVAQKFGISTEQASDKLAHEVPKAVDEQTPDGSLDSEER